MRSDDLAYIISSAIDYKEKNLDTGALLNSWKVADYYEKYDDKDKNFLMADTLNALDKVIIFKISNYSSEFSTEYKKTQNIDGRFTND